MREAPGSEWDIGYIEAWRVWNFRDVLVDPGPIHPRRELRLVSFAAPGNRTPIWEPYRRFEAVCPQGKSPPCQQPCGAYGHGCGVYAVKSRQHLSAFHPNEEHAWVVGRIALWGTTWEHAIGYRAQFAYPLEFISIRSGRTTWRSHLLERLSLAYGLPW